MTLAPFDMPDYLAEARSRVTQQFKNQDVFDRYVQLLEAAQPALLEAFRQLKQLRSLDEATGVQLDILGAIVGQPRDLIAFTDIPAFGFQGFANALPFEDLDNPGNGGVFYSLSTSSVPDSLYRTLIKARIHANSTKCRPEDIITQLKLLLGDASGTFFELGDANVMVAFGRPLTTLETYLVVNGYTNLVTFPIGVGVKYLQYTQDNYFGFAGSPGVKGFSDLSNPSVEGGLFASLIE